MGFFQDLKEDLSQAVNELIPEENEVKGNLKEDDGLAEIEAMFRQKQEQEELQEQEIELEEEQIELEEGLAELEEQIELEEEQIDNVEEEPVEVPVEEPEKETIREGRERKLDMNAIFNQAAHNDEVSTITSGMTISGDITTQGSLDLVGCVHGNICVAGKMSITGMIEGNSQASEIYAESAKITGEVRSQGSVKVGQETVIIGNIFATSAVIAGAVKGDIDVQGPVVLDTSAIVMGNIKSKSVQINNGAVIEGMCSQCYADINPTSFFEEIKKAGR
ncbi:MAG: polymer-forming cytoskeletal protein [Lachnospiraceae bacterium]|nr:polymer-forming cytoskeletal protein [Lachnospiraceae bacterium]